MKNDQESTVGRFSHFYLNHTYGYGKVTEKCTLNSLENRFLSSPVSMLCLEGLAFTVNLPKESYK